MKRIFFQLKEFIDKFYCKKHNTSQFFNYNDKKLNYSSMSFENNKPESLDSLIKDLFIGGERTIKCLKCDYEKKLEKTLKYFPMIF